LFENSTISMKHFTVQALGVIVLLAINNEISVVNAKSSKATKLPKASKGSKSAKKIEEPTPQEGFEFGMAKEIEGLWVGEERWSNSTLEDRPYDIIYNYCSRALFNPTNGKNLLTWEAAYLDDTDGSCENLNVDPLSGTVNGDLWFASLDPNAAFILQIEEKKCLPESKCDYDVLSSGDFADFEVTAKACGAHLKRDQIYDNYYSCELYQTNLLYNANTNETKSVVVLTYTSFEGGYDNYICPERPTFSNTELLADGNAEGIAQFVLQRDFSYQEANPDVTAWDCLYS